MIGGRDVPRQSSNRPVAARTINRFQAAVEALTRAQTLSGGGIGLDRRGRRERGFHAKLSGSSSPYSFAEVYGKMVGSVLTWEPVPRGRTGSAVAYEDNSLAGLGDKVAWLEPSGAAGVWRFGFNRKQQHCTLNFILIRTNNCGAVGATVDFVETVSGVTVWSTTITSTTGGAAFPFAVPGRAYTINYTYFSISGSASTTGCSGVSRSIANPPESGLPNSCYEPMPPVLYVTDDWGTHQVWPTPECFESPIVGSPYKYTQRLQPNGSCAAPGFSLIYQNWTAGPSCTVPGVGIIAGSSPFLRNCASPFLYSGTYPPAPPFGPSHPLPGRPFLVHE